MRTKPGVDTLSFDDLYKNLRVFESDVKGSTTSSYSIQNIHGASFSTEDANQKFLRSLPASWSQVSLIMRTKPGVDTLSFDDLYNNLRVFESDVKGSTTSSYSIHNVTFVSSESTSSTNEANTAYDNGRRRGKQEEPKALVTLDGDGVDWTGHLEDEQENFALMAYNNSGSDTEREQLGDASIEMHAYDQALKRPRNNVYKSHSPIKMPFNRTTAPKDNFSYHKVNTVGDKTVSAIGGNRKTAVNALADCNWRPKIHYLNKVSKYNSRSNSSKNDDPQKALKNKGIVDSGCSRHMTGNKAYLVDYQDYNGGSVAFGGSKGHISGKGKIRTGKLDFEDVCFVKELQHFNIFSVSQMCYNKKKVLFTDTEYLMLSPDFKLSDENQVLLRVLDKNNMYSFNLENIVPTEGLACLIAKATVDESNKWHRRLGHVNIKNLNKLVKGNLVRGLPSKIFQNDHTCVACQKGKQHKASWIKREYSNARTPQQDGIAKRKNKTLIEAARTILADSFIPNTFWAEAVSTACYVLNRVLVTKP
nr:ribonuclease H-like domain-containing protein [Tanacetum cinerariifolium]